MIEVATVYQRRDILLAQGGTYIPGKDVKNTLDRKFKGQLNAGNSNPGMPILIILHLENFGPGLGSLEIQNGIYGVLSVSPVEDEYTLEKNGFYDEPGSNIVTAIGVYYRDLGEENPLVGKFYTPTVAPVNELSVNFYRKISEALFGKSEPNN